MRNEETWWSLIGIVVIAAVVEVVVVVVVRGTISLSGAELHTPACYLKV
jgi:hypothetical protein